MVRVLVLWGVMLSAMSFGPPTVKKFDLKRYMGNWHQIGTIPAWFQRDCATNTTATYSLLKNKVIKVVNKCVTREGKEKKAIGRGRVNPLYRKKSKLQVTFAKILGRYRFLLGGDYWVLDIDKDYQVSLVGDPTRRFFWILARSPQLERDTLIAIEKKVKKLGYDSCRVIVTQDGVDTKKRLCDLKK